MSRYFQVSVKGGMGSQDVWSVNPVFDPAGELPFDWNQEDADQITDAMAAITLPAALRAAMSTAVSVASYRLELRDTGNDTLYGVSEKVLASPINGTGVGTKPPQSAIVCSLRTNTPGASGRGRLYWPALGLATNASTFRVTPGDSLAIASGISSYLTSIKNAILSTGEWEPWTDMQLVVRSRVRRENYAVQRIQVGDVIDTQRRRRDAVPEQIQVVPYPAS